MEIKDTGGRREFPGGGVRDMGGGKGRCDLLPAAALLKLAKYYEQGAEKYGINNWRGLPEWTFIDSGLRHLLKHMDGQTDEDHLTAATWNLLSAMWLREKGEAQPKQVPSEITENNCRDCKYELCKMREEPCRKCYYMYPHPNWQPKEAAQCK